MLIYTQFRRPPTRLHVCKHPSRTIPDQTISLKVMVKKYVNGLPISAPNLKGTYTGDEVAQDFEKLDLADQEQAILNASEELSEHKAKIANEQKETAANAKKEAEKDKERIKELESQLAKPSINPS